MMKRLNSKFRLCQFFIQKQKCTVALMVALIVCAQFMLPQAALAQTQWQARLSPNPISFGTRATLIGLGEVTAGLEGNVLIVQGAFYGLAGKATTVKLHQGPLAIPGPELMDLSLQLKGDGKQGTFAAQLELTAEQQQALVNKRLYIQLNSDVAKDGNLRGWLLPSK